MAAAKPLKVNGSGKVAQFASTDVIPAANLGTGTPDATKWLAGDGTWKDVLSYTTTQILTTLSPPTFTPPDGYKVWNSTEQAEWYYSSVWGWESNSLSYRRKYGTEYFNEFTSLAISDGMFVAGGTLTAPATNEFNRLGGITLSTSTTSTGSSRIATDASTASSIILGGGRFLYEVAVKIITLSTVSEEFSCGFGLTGNTITPTLTNGIMFFYDRVGAGTGSAASANWQVATAVAGVRSYTTTSVPVVAGQFYRLTWIANAAGTSVEFYIDGVLVKTETTNIGTQGGLTNFILKSAGTTARTMQLDYIYFKQKFTTPR